MMAFRDTPKVVASRPSVVAATPCGGPQAMLAMRPAANMQDGPRQRQILAASPLLVAGAVSPPLCCSSPTRSQATRRPSQSTCSDASTLLITSAASPVMRHAGGSVWLPCVRPDGLEKDLQRLRFDMDAERQRSRELAAAVREQLFALDAELRDTNSVRQELAAIAALAEQQEHAASDMSSDGRFPLQVIGETVEVASYRPPSDSSTATPMWPKDADGAASWDEAAEPLDALSVHEGAADCDDQDSPSQAQLAIRLALELQQSVQGLMTQGLEFRELAGRREEALQAALQASENARMQAEATASAALADAAAARANNVDSRIVGSATKSGLEDNALSGAEREVHEAKVRRLEAHVQALELQVECLNAELALSRSTSRAPTLLFQQAHRDIESDKDDNAGGCSQLPWSDNSQAVTQNVAAPATLSDGARPPDNGQQNVVVGGCLGARAG